MRLQFEDARHLLARTGFGARYDDIDALVDRDRDAVVDALLAVDTAPRSDPPAWVDEPVPSRIERRLNREKLRKQARERALELKAWWLREMTVTDAPIADRMTLFWANHFTSSFRKVRWPGFLWTQHLTLRSHALGSFRDLLHAIVRDPAMLIYLDNHQSHRDAPNENFARELLELFTLGEGHYAEADIKAAARALTGYSIRRASGEFRFKARDHDDGTKTFLGQRGDFDGDDIVEIILEQPRTAELITEKLWAAFVSRPLDEATRDALAATFRESDYAIAALVGAVLRHDAFADRAEHGQLVRSPVELIVGTLRAMAIEPPAYDPLAKLTRRLGQDLFDPPNVKGWPGGTRWITSTRLLTRQQALRRAAGHPKVGGAIRKLGLGAVVQEVGLTGDDARTLVEAVYLPLPAMQAIPDPNDDPVGTFEALLLDPVAQLT